MKLNLPNKLTLARIIITPVFLAVIMWEGLEHRYLIADIIFVIASITDAVDGHLARKYNEITNFGKLLDPIADKILTTAALLAFLQLGLCNVWIVMIVLTREFAVSSIRMISAANGTVIPANIFGKIKTASQMVFTIIIMLLCEWGEYNDNILLVTASVSSILLWITAVLALISGIIYINDSRKYIDYSK